MDSPTVYAIHVSEDARERLMRVILNRIGEERAVKKRELLRLVFSEGAAADESYNNKYDRSLREMIEAINQAGGMICSSPSAGYWWAASLEDGLPAAESARRRALKQLGNADRLLENIKKEYGGQLSLL